MADGGRYEVRRYSAEYVCRTDRSTVPPRLVFVVSYFVVVVCVGATSNL